MWKIEIAYKYTNIVSHLVFDEKEQAELERDKLTPHIGKDLYDLKKNGKDCRISLIDKFGTIDVVPDEVKTVRCYDADAWDSCALPRILEFEREKAKAKKID